jgi:hypothetical protein
MSSKQQDNPIKLNSSQESNSVEKSLITWNKKQLKKSMNFTKKILEGQSQEEMNKMFSENYNFVKSSQLNNFSNLNKYEQEKLKLTELEKEKETLKQDMEVQGLFFKKISDENHDYRQIKENLEKLLKEELLKKQQLLEDKKVNEL